MRVSECIGCQDFPCADVKPACYQVPAVEIDPQQVSILLVSEAAPVHSSDGYYMDLETPENQGAGPPLFAQTTVLAFQDAGAPVKTIQDILGLGVYLTTAVKCGKTGYAISAGTIDTCSYLLEKELALFPKVKTLLLMGDVAIRAVNTIARRAGLPRVIPAGSTYKLRGQEYFFHGARAFPSYLQAGPSFFIEKSKRQMIAQDIAAALTLR